MATVIQQHPVMEALFWQTGAEGGRGGNVGTGMERRGGEDRGNKTRVDRQRGNILMKYTAVSEKSRQGVRVDKDEVGKSEATCKSERKGLRSYSMCSQPSPRSAANHFFNSLLWYKLLFFHHIFLKININKSKKKKRRNMELQHWSRFPFLKKEGLVSGHPYLTEPCETSVLKPPSALPL